ncbi:MAG: hypothetical protein LBC80_04350 [Treponema sp.]|jgi:hypothetical protein|nr:hypothetical protein [Treponema sp.]
MKTLKKTWCVFLVMALFFSCNRAINVMKEQIVQETTVDTIVAVPETVNENISERVSETDNISLLIRENRDLLTDHYWSISDGRWLEGGQTHDWVGSMTPHAVFYKLEIPPNSVIYQERLRREIFYFLYQTEESDNFFPIGLVSNEPFEIIFNDNFSFFRKLRGGRHFSVGNRIGEQTNLNYPLVGIWEEYSFINEYHLVDPLDSLYYMVIDKAIPFWAVREGTYLIRQTGGNTFETVSSFPDGRLQLEVKSNRQMVLRPLFELPDDEEGLVDILIMDRNQMRISEIPEEYLNSDGW